MYTEQKYTGTTAIAAIETGRNWLLIEKDPEYYQVAKERIEKRLQQPFLPGVVTAHNNQNAGELLQPGLLGLDEPDCSQP